MRDDRPSSSENFLSDLYFLVRTGCQSAGTETEESIQIVLADQLGETVDRQSVDDGAEEVTLLFEQPLDAFFYRIGADERGLEDGLVLAEVVGAGGGLCLDGRIPPAVEVDDTVGGLEVQSDPAGADRYQQGAVPWVGSELVNGLFASLASHATVVVERNVVTQFNWEGVGVL